MSRSFSLLAVLLVAAPVSADDKDWVGKLVMLRSDDVRSGKPDGKKLVRSGAVLTADYVYKVRTDRDGLLEFVGSFGWVEKSEAVTVAEAVAFFTDKIKAEPKEAKWHGRRALAHLNHGRNNIGFSSGASVRGGVDAALADLAEAIRLAPKESAWWSHRGWLHIQRREFDKAIEDYSEAIRLNPDWHGNYAGRGAALWTKKEFDKAIEDYTRGLELAPNSAELLNARGIAWRAKKEYDKAIEDYSRAVKADPNYVLAFNNRGNAWRDKKEYDKAIADFTKAIELDPTYAGAFGNRGLLLADKGEHEKAIADYDKAVSLDPKNAQPIRGKAKSLAKLKKYDEAVRGFQAALKLAPANEWVHRDFAFFLATCPDAKYRDGKQAVELAHKAIELAGKVTDWRFYAALAAAHAEAGEFDSAVADQRQALGDKSLDAEDRKALERRLALYRTGKPYRDEE